MSQFTHSRVPVKCVCVFSFRSGGGGGGYGASPRDCLMSRACFQFVTSCITNIFCQIILFERLQLGNNPCR